MAGHHVGRILGGDEQAIRQSVETWSQMPIDMTLLSEPQGPVQATETTLANPFHATGPGTYTRTPARTLYFEPTDEQGWWIDRVDQKGQLPIRVSVRNVWTTARSIVLRSGDPHNYIRMVEHIIALRLGLGLDNVMIRIDSGDPPLFAEGSKDIVEGATRAGVVDQPGRPLTYWTVKEPVTLGGRSGSFLTVAPAERGSRTLSVDCAVDFPNAIGTQRIQFAVSPGAFQHGAQARTNCTRGMMLYCRTIGKLFADVRNLGYTPENILIAGRKGYVNEPRLLHEGKSLEAVWHRACLDLLAALSLIETGRLAGRVCSYKAGHALDVEMVSQLYIHKLLEEVKSARDEDE